MNSGQAANLDDPQCAIDFVFFLEQPYLYQVQDDPCVSARREDYLDAQSPLESVASGSTSSSPTRHGVTKDIESLLDFSSRLNLAGVITPVQAWSKLRSHPMSPNLSIESFERLKTSMMLNTKYFG